MRKKHTLRILVFFIGFISIEAQENSERINHSRIAFTLSEKDLLPENMAYDTQTESFFVGSTRKGKIIKIDKHGTQSDFVSSKQNDMWMVIGMKTDVVNRWLWVCSSGGENLEGYSFKDDVEGRPAGIFKFDIDSGTLIKKYTLENKGEVHFFNDLVLDSSGNAFITHMFKTHAIYTIQKEKDVLELFLKADHLKYPNGITISDDNNDLFLAHSEGLLSIHIASKRTTAIQLPEVLSLSKRASMDGLYFYNNTLIGIQPSLKMVQQLVLNKAHDTVISATILEANHPMMNHPTTGVLVNQNFYYIANAQFESFEANGKLFPMEKLYEPVILKVNLKK